eukprot:TRINITY_DN58029_c0_g1_i1.p1 TRINITY_DN58029_c0_g1~~TRINITY_DN58029_c0_g1_i1.p1  ORF type:complete len:136 (+),score=18.47 TRINITY_DN58029_c0_g1_i1:1-408(+)
MDGRSRVSDHFPLGATYQQTSHQELADRPQTDWVVLPDDAWNKEPFDDTAVEAAESNWARKVPPPGPVGHVRYWRFLHLENGKIEARVFFIVGITQTEKKEEVLEHLAYRNYKSCECDTKAHAVFDIVARSARST